MSRPTTKLSVIDTIRTHFPDLVLVETTDRTIASGVTAYQIIGGQRKPTVKKPEEPAGKPPNKPS
jgi:hypothetical protein